MSRSYVRIGPLPSLGTMISTRRIVGYAQLIAYLDENARLYPIQHRSGIGAVFTGDRFVDHYHPEAGVQVIVWAGRTERHVSVVGVDFKPREHLVSDSLLTAINDYADSRYLRFVDRKLGGALLA